MRRRAVLLLTVMTTVLLGVASPAWAETFTVNSTADRGDQTPGDGSCWTGVIVVPTPGSECTLRAAIEEANAFSGADTIGFDIPGTGTQTISPGLGGLPPITQQVTIDGYTQDGATENTHAAGTNAVLKIELDGTAAGTNVQGLTVQASNGVIRGLVISNFSVAGIYLDGGPGHKVEGNFIGTDADGTAADGNGYGMIVDAGGSTIGGTSLGAPNLIARNDLVGVWLQPSSLGNKIQGNLIGTRDGAEGNLGNGFSGVLVQGGGNTIGGAFADNTIAFNGRDGVSVVGETASGNHILTNSIFLNGGLGIDLGDDNVTTNDPNDPDTGANRLQNFPDLASATVPSGGQVTITGNLNSTPSTLVKKKKKKKKKKRKVFIPQVYTVQFFSNPAGEDEGKTFIGQATVATSLSGNAPINQTFTPSQPVAVGERITATATRSATGDTSEFSNAVTAS